MNPSHLLIGLDFGTTTSHCVLAKTEIQKNSVLGRREFANTETLYKSTPVFTPIREGRVQLDSIRELIQRWKKESNLDWKDVIGGGALLTGLTSKSESAPELITLLKSELENLLVITAEDPLLESWVSGIANCQTFMQKLPGIKFLNLDIGGGTTNISLCKDGEVLDTLCEFIGARHFIFSPGSYSLIEISKPGKDLLKKLKIVKNVGESLSQEDVSAICEDYVKRLEKIVQGYPNSNIVFSGGVAELLYEETTERITPFGDLGTDLAFAISKSKLLSKNLDRFVPETKGRATVFGIALHSTQISGDSIYSNSSLSLPLELPIRGSIHQDEIGEPGAYFIEPASVSTETFKQVAGNISKFLSSQKKTGPYVFLMEPNLGKIFGSWIALSRGVKSPIFVIDEISFRRAHYLTLGKWVHQNIPVTLYGFE